MNIWSIHLFPQIPEKSGKGTAGKQDFAFIELQ
jgi:hypothetical protein